MYFFLEKKMFFCLFCFLIFFFIFFLCFFEFLTLFCCQFSIFWILSKLIRLLRNLMEVTTEHQKWPKISTNSVKALLLPEGQKTLGNGRSPRQEQEVSPRSELYLLVIYYLVFAWQCIFWNILTFSEPILLGFDIN